MTWHQADRDPGENRVVCKLELSHPLEVARLKAACGSWTHRGVWRRGRAKAGAEKKKTRNEMKKKMTVGGASWLLGLCIGTRAEEALVGELLFDGHFITKTASHLFLIHNTRLYKI